MTAPVPREHRVGPAIAFVSGADGQEMTAPEGAFSALHYEYLVFELNGSVTVSGGTSNGTVATDAPESLVKRIQIILTGTQGDAFLDIPLTELRFLTHYHTRHNPGMDNERTAPTAGIGTNLFSSRVVLPFALEDMADEAKYRGFWASNRFTGVRVKVTWGTIANLISGGDRTNVVDATTNLTIWGREYARDARFVQAADLLLWQRVTKDFVINNIAQSDFDMEVARTASFLRAIEIRQMTIVAGVETALNDTLIRPTDKITLMFDDSDKKYEYTWGYLRFLNRERNRVAMPTGTAVIDLSPNGDMQLLEQLLNHTKTYIRIDNAAIANGVVRTVVSKYANHP